MWGCFTVIVETFPETSLQGVGITRRPPSPIRTRLRRHASFATLPSFAADADDAGHRLHRDHQPRVKETDAALVGLHQVGDLDVVLQGRALVARTETEPQRRVGERLLELVGFALDPDAGGGVKDHCVGHILHLQPFQPSIDRDADGRGA